MLLHTKKNLNEKLPRAQNTYAKQTNISPIMRPDNLLKILIKYSKLFLYTLLSF